MIKEIIIQKALVFFDHVNNIISIIHLHPWGEREREGGGGGKKERGKEEQGEVFFSLI